MSAPNKINKALFFSLYNRIFIIQSDLPIVKSFFRLMIATYDRFIFCFIVSMIKPLIKALKEV